MKVAIRPAREDERDWCAQLMAGSEPWIALGRGLAQCRARCSHPEYLLWVAEAEGTPCGFILLHPRGLAGSPYVAAIAVEERFRGRGVGTLLLDRAEAHFASAGHLFLCVSSFNERARRLYERRGYAAVGALKDYVIEGASEILMHKTVGRTPSSAAGPLAGLL